jgi:predicted glycosyltransferase
MTQAMSAKGQMRKQARIHDQIRQYYDLVLYHSDRHFQPLEACFPTAPNLNCEVYYTGYVAQSVPAEPLISLEEQALLDKADPIIVASAGGGRDGYPLLKAMVAACPYLAQAIPHRIYVFAGPFLPAPQFTELQRLAASQPNLTLRRFTPHLLAYLSRADLSVSLGGYNTTMSILRAGVRSLILPSPSVDQVDEQRRRAARLAAMGVIGLLDPADLDPVRLAQKMLVHLNQPKPTHAINLNGAQNTARLLQALLYEATVSGRPEAIAFA